MGSIIKKYGAILIDPPWNFKVYKPGDRCAASKYKVLNLEDIKALDFGKYADDNCAMFMWAIDPMIPEALSLMSHYGFRFKTVFQYWVKSGKAPGSFPMGMGYWTRANPEMCLLGTKGSPKRLSKSIPRLLISPRREHSRKPDEVYGRIESLVSGPYLEVFARQEAPGWDCLGNETSKFKLGE